ARSREDVIAHLINRELKALGKKDTVTRSRTKNGQWKHDLDKLSLERYSKAGSGLAVLIRKWRQADKDITTYFGPYLKVRADRIRSDISTGAARTGRMTSSKPNVQNVPPTVKPCFMADPGMVLVSADFSSVEMR